MFITNSGLISFDRFSSSIFKVLHPSVYANYMLWKCDCGILYPDPVRVLSSKRPTPVPRFPCRRLPGLAHPPPPPSIPPCLAPRLAYWSHQQFDIHIHDQFESFGEATGRWISTAGSMCVCGGGSSPSYPAHPAQPRPSKPCNLSKQPRNMRRALIIPTICQGLSPS